MPARRPSAPRRAPGWCWARIGYLSPEQARGEAVTTASDVFALGILLYELLTGQHPFHAPSPLAVLHSITSDAPVPPSRLGLEVPPAMDQLVLECLQKDARMRPTTAEIAARLRGAARRGRARCTLLGAVEPQQPAASWAATARWTSCCRPSSRPATGPAG